jgi:hypothetical protein
VTERFLGDFDNSGSGAGRVLDIASGKVVSQWDACVAGGSQYFGLLPGGRYFVCAGSRTGSRYRDLGRRGREVPFGQRELFAVVVPREFAVYDGRTGERLAHAPAMPGGALAFDPSGRYLMQSRRGASTIYRLEP